MKSINTVHSTDSFNSDFSSPEAGHTPLIQFELDYIQFINEHGNWVNDQPIFATEKWLVDAYKHMAMNRVFDQKAIALQRTGQTLLSRSWGTYFKGA